MQITRSIDTQKGPDDWLMTHVAMRQHDETGSPVTWGEHVSDEQYGAGDQP